ncbi:MAG: CvpA family protein [Holosporaceae bacterium]|jgi:membrane protein required for colicin V production|nr:CvpA family protein [Rhodospirillaceae bacterium]
MLTLADIAIIAVIGLSALFAFVRGFVRELFGIGSWIGAAIITFFGYPFSTQLGRELIENRLFAEVAGIAGLFVVSLVSFSLIAHVVSDQVRDSIFSGADRALGLAFGVIRGLFVVALVLLGIHNFGAPESLPAWYKDSTLVPVILEYSQQGLHEATKNYGLGGDGAGKPQDGDKQGGERQGGERQGGENPDGQQQDGNKDGATTPAPHDGQHEGAAPNHPTPPNPTPNNAAPPAPTPAAPTPAATPSAKPGYGIEERKRLDDLFTKKP